MVRVRVRVRVSVRFRVSMHTMCAQILKLKPCMNHPPKWIEISHTTVVKRKI